MPAPEFVVCLDCEMPTYVFEWKDEEIVEIVCESCGNDSPDQFMTEEEFEALSG